jgi:hypothetical protein
MTTTSHLACPPRYATSRNLDHPTLGPAVGKVARLLGKPFMPWQQHVADVVMEVDPATGLLVYRDWGLTVPRQSGKTTFILAKAVHRSMATDYFGPRQRLVYTAQTRNDARRKWEEDFVEDLESARAFRGKFAVRKSNGSEHVRFANGSRLGIDAGTDKSGHGGTIDEPFIDEAFSRIDGRQEQAFKPAMVTRVLAQFGVISTAGWEGESPYLWDKVELGRRIIVERIPSRYAYFEWSAPEGADYRDRAAWRLCMPGLRCNGGLIDEEIIAADLETMKPNEFRRAYLNHWVPKDAPPEPIIDDSVWSSKADADTGRLVPVAFGVTVAPGRSHTTIAVAGQRTDGRAQIEVMAERPGVDWAIDWVADRVERWDPCAVVLDGTADGLAPGLAEHGIEAEKTASTVRAQATVDLYDAVTEDRLRHTGDPLLAAEVASAQKRLIGDRWVWEGSVQRLQAVTLAHHGLITYGRARPAPPAPRTTEDDHPRETTDLIDVGF